MNEPSTGSRGRRGRILGVVVVLLLIAVFGIRFRQLSRSEALASVSSVQETEGETVRHAAVGKLVAERAVKAGVKDVVFDRGAYIFHGRVKALADAAREAGLNF